jgi:hypothetical protein
MEDHIVGFWQTIATVSLSVLITLIGFWVGIGRKILTRDEISKMIANDSAYTKEREFIMERLASNKEAYNALSVTLQKVIEVMNELKIQIATLAKTLDNLEKQIEENE